MNYSNIIYYDIANGVGVRTTLFVSGCRNHCTGCFQPETWNFDYGEPFTEEIAKEIIASCKEDYVEGLTLLGGDPFEEENQACLASFTTTFKTHCPNKTIWAFTGYQLEDLLENGKKHIFCTDELLNNIDVLVDGPFILNQKNLCLKFRGSENQRIIDLNKFKKFGKIVEIE